MAKKLEYFTGEEKDELEPWLDRFDAIIEAEGKEQKAAAIMRTCLKGDAAMVIQSMSEDDRKQIDAIKEELRKNFGKRKDELAAQREFHSRKLEPGETIGKYVRSLKKLAVEGFLKCVGAGLDSIIKGQFIEGLPSDLSDQLSTALQYKVAEASLVDVVNFASNWQKYQTRETFQACEKTIHVAQVETDINRIVSEAVETAVKGLEETISSMVDAQVNRIYKNTSLDTNRNGRPQSRRPEPNSKRCFECNQVGHLRRNCPQRMQCFRCQRFGHRAAVCPGYYPN